MFGFIAGHDEQAGRAVRGSYRRPALGLKLRSDSQHVHGGIVPVNRNKVFTRLKVPLALFKLSCRDAA